MVGGVAPAAEAALAGLHDLHEHNSPSFLLPQVTKYVEREIINHRQLVHPHIVQFKEVGLVQSGGLVRGHGFGFSSQRLT